jgi:Ca-activated chloride channel family protein
MVMEEIIPLAFWAALGALVLAGFAEWLHARRVRRLARLAFGPDESPRLWTALVPVLRVLALAGVVWGLVVLMAFDGSSRARERKAKVTRHLMVMLDVSPSMQLQDAGEGGASPRAAQAASLLKSVLDRAPGDEVRVSMACFYTDTMPLVTQCSDREVVMNFADNLPLHMAYRPGKTDLVKSLNTAGEMVKDFPRKSTTVLVLSDGDTVPDSGLKPMPSSVSTVIFAGVGDPMRGTFIDGHLSRQDNGSLSQLARRLGGQYHNGNRLHVPSEMLRRLIAPDETESKVKINLRVLALIVLSSGAVLLCGLPLLLEYFGSAWKPVVNGARVRPAAQPAAEVAA